MAEIAKWSKYIGLGGAAMELHESIPVWLLTRSSFSLSDDVPLARRSENTGVWHHQLKVNGQFSVFARSYVAAGGEFRLLHLALSYLGEKVDAGLVLAERALGGSVGVRLLEVPTFGMSSLWAQTEVVEKIVVLTKPASNTVPSGELMDPITFIRRVRVEESDPGIAP